MALITGNERLADRLRLLASLLMLVLVIAVWINRVAGTESAADLVLIGGLLTVSLGLGVVVAPALPRRWRKSTFSLVGDEPVQRWATGDHPEYEQPRYLLLAQDPKWASGSSSNRTAPGWSAI